MTYNSEVVHVSVEANTVIESAKANNFGLAVRNEPALRVKRAASAGATCNLIQCLESGIQIQRDDSKVPLSACQTYCYQSLNLISYSFNAGTHTGHYSCACYLANCCNFTGRVIAPSNESDIVYVISHCDDIFSSVSNVVVNKAQPYRETDIVNVTCNSGYVTLQLQSTVSYTCLQTGLWSPASVGICVATCPNLFDATGTVNPGPPFLSGISYKFRCLPNYLLPNGFIIQTYLCSSGSWNSAFTQCHATCQRQFDYYGKIVPGPYMHEHPYNFTCIDNATTLSNDIVQTYTCVEGNWSKAFAPCYAPCCKFDPHLMTLQQSVNYNTTNSTNLVKSGTVGKFACPQNLTLYGSFKSSLCTNGSWDLSASNFPICLEQVADYKNEQLAQAISDARSDKLSTATVSIDLISYIWSNLTSNTRSVLSLKQDEVILGCVFNKRPCDMRNEIYNTQSLTSGNCYTFNHKFLSSRLNTEKAGSPTGLSWYLNANQDEFFATTIFAGTKLIIQEPFDPLLTDARGIAVSPGFVYDIKITKASEIRIKTPVQTCISEATDVSYYFYNYSSYLHEGCLRTVLQHKLIAKCNCSAPSLPNEMLSANVCSLEQRKCIQQGISSSMNDYESEEVCSKKCSEIIYHPIIVATVPVYNGPFFTSFNFSETYIKNNLMKVNLYFSSLEEIQLVESLSYTLLQLISDIGSIMGLWLSVSMISLVELLVLVVKLIKRC